MNMNFHSYYEISANNEITIHIRVIVSSIIIEIVVIVVCLNFFGNHTPEERLRIIFNVQCLKICF